MYHNLIAEMARNNITQLDLCKSLDKNKTTINLKMNGKRDFKLQEMVKIQKLFFPNMTLDYLFEKKEN